jgi:hypothetical protein
MAMDDYSADYTLREQCRKAAALDRQLTHCGWFRRNEHRPRRGGWRFRIGEALIRLGCRLQNRGPIQPAGTSGGL